MWSFKGTSREGFFFVFLHSHFDAYNGVVGGLRLDETERGIGENGMEGGKADELCLGARGRPIGKPRGLICSERFTLSALRMGSIMGVSGWGSYCWFKIELTGTAYTHIRIPIPNPEKVEKENEALLDIIPVGRFFLHLIPLLPS